MNVTPQVIVLAELGEGVSAWLRAPHSWSRWGELFPELMFTVDLGDQGATFMATEPPSSKYYYVGPGGQIRVFLSTPQPKL